MGKNFKKGMILTVISTIIFGITPVLGKMSYAYGNNGIQLVFLRNFFAIPVFIFMIFYKHLSFKVTRQQMIDIIKVSMMSVLTIILLYSSYSYIQVGCATVLHFLYPLFVCLFNFIIYKQKLSKKQLVCLLLAFLGICCFFEKTTASIIGFFLAVISGLFFAMYMLGMDHSQIKEVSPYVFNFYLIIVSCFISLIVAVLTKQVNILHFQGYVLSFLVGIFTSGIAVVLFQKGIHYLGSSLTSILSTLEPLTSIVIGMMFLNESLTYLKIIGCFLVLGSTFIIVYHPQKEDS